jgi:hypothetical protein
MKQVMDSVEMETVPGEGTTLVLVKQRRHMEVPVETLQA